MLRDPSPSAGMFGISSACMPSITTTTTTTTTASAAAPLSAHPVMTLTSPSSSSTSASGNLSNSRSDKPALLKHDFAVLATSNDSSSYNTRSAEPVLSAHSKKKMITQTSLLEIPRTAKYYDLAWFLKHTGPDGIHDSPKRTASTTKSAFRFFKIGSKAATSVPSTVPVSKAHKDLNDILLFDKGGLLVPEGVEQKMTLTGKPYLAMSIGPNKKAKIKHEAEGSEKQEPPLMKSDSARVMPTDVTDRHYSDISTLTASHEWLLKYDGREPSPVSPVSSHEPTKDDPREADLTTTHPIDIPSSPIRPAASNPPTPPPESATTIAEAYRCDLTEHPAKISVNFTDIKPKKSKEVMRKPVTPMPTLALQNEEFPVSVPTVSTEINMQHPSPRRFASHPVLHRASNLVEAVLPRSMTESPGTPPPKSPLRLRRDHRTIERSVESGAKEEKSTQRMAPTIQSSVELAKRHATIVPTVTTECIGPLSRSSPHTRIPVKHMLYPASKKEREERIRARKLYDKSQSISRNIDTVVCDRPSSPRQRLRKIRPQITTPELSSLRPAPLITRVASTRSKKPADAIATWTSPLASSQHSDSTHQHSRVSSSITADTPVSPSVTDSASGDNKVLVAEEIPIPKTKSPFRAARIVVAKERVYTPRPRSASMPRSTGKRRSRNSVTMPSRVLTPEMPEGENDVPPLPSPPPNRALPPTPPASGSENSKRKACGIPAPYATPLLAPAQDWSSAPVLGRARQYVSTHNESSQASQPADGLAQLNARLAYLEKSNHMLSAALMAVLSTNGESNMPLRELLGRNSPKYAMTWEDRVTRRSEASHGPSSSNGSALDFYFSTKRNSKVCSSVVCAENGLRVDA